MTTCLGDRQADPQELLSQLQQSAGKHQHEVGAISHLLLLHVRGHHDHLSSRMLHLMEGVSLTAS